MKARIVRVHPQDAFIDSPEMLDLVGVWNDEGKSVLSDEGDCRCYRQGTFVSQASERDYYFTGVVVVEELPAGDALLD